MRVYVPATVADLAAWVDAGEVPASAERFVPADDAEEAEYATLEAAADESAGLLHGPGRRVVVVAEVPDADAAFPWRLVEAVHADTEPYHPRSDGDAPDLGWYAAQEVADLLG